MVAELLREAAVTLDEQRDKGSETATNMPAPDRTGEGRANCMCHFSACIGYFTEITSQGRYLPWTICRYPAAPLELQGKGDFVESTATSPPPHLSLMLLHPRHLFHHPRHPFQEESAREQARHEESEAN
ncbi:unnamed protein product [Boreogadus saida]